MTLIAVIDIICINDCYIAMLLTPPIGVKALYYEASSLVQLHIKISVASFMASDSPSSTTAGVFLKLSELQTTFFQDIMQVCSFKMRKLVTTSITGLS